MPAQTSRPPGEPGSGPSSAGGGGSAAGGHDQDLAQRGPAFPGERAQRATEGVDLHVHSAASDGLLAPAELALRAAAAGIGTLALTDHDTTAGWAELAGAAPAGLRCIPAIELTARVREGPLGTVHVLGYGVDLAAAPLVAAARANRLAKREQVRAILAWLARDEGIELAWEDVAAGRGDDAYVGRHHVAGLLVERGHAATRLRAFRRYLRAERVPAVDVVPAREAVEAIAAAGGVAVLAHPTHHDLDEHLKPLADLGLRGIEVYRPRAQGDLLKRVLRVVAKHGLAVTGGSDWHGHYPDPPLGTWQPPRAELEAFLARIPHGLVPRPRGNPL